MKKYLDLLIFVLIIAVSAVAQTVPETIIKDTINTLDSTANPVVNLPENTPETASVHEGSHVSKEVVPKINGKTMLGIASFYSRSLEGSETATGETFHHANMTGASNFFKLNTWVRVTNLSNGRSIIVRINDRMAVRMAKIGRVVDLTKTGAVKLNFVNSGITKVKIEEVTKGTVE